MVTLSLRSLCWSSSVNEGRVANACQYLRAAFALRLGGASADADTKVSPRRGIARQNTRSISSTSQKKVGGRASFSMLGPLSQSNRSGGIVVETKMGVVSLIGQLNVGISTSSGTRREFRHAAMAEKSSRGRGMDALGPGLGSATRCANGRV